MDSVAQCDRDLIDRKLLMKAMEEIVYAVRQHWGVGSTEHNLVRDICDQIVKVPSTPA